MPQSGFEPTKVGVTGFQLNAKWMLYLQATTAGCILDLFCVKIIKSKSKKVRGTLNSTNIANLLN